MRRGVRAATRRSCGHGTSRPVSRVLSGCRPRRSDIRDGHSSGMSIAGHLKQPTRATGLETDFEPGCPARGRPYLVLLPVGFTVPRPLPARAVRSYRTLSSLLPRLARRFGGLLSVALSLELPPAAVSRHRVSMEPGLSSADQPIANNRHRRRPSGRLVLGVSTKQLLWSSAIA